MKRLKTALLGIRGVGADYLDALCGDDQFELVAVGDTDARVQADRLAELGVRRYTDFRSLIVETASVGLDLLVVAMEPRDRQSLPAGSTGFVTLAASRGVHVFHKAPFARGVDEGREIVRLFADHKAKIVVARPWEFDPALAPLASLEQLVGQVYAATAFVTVGPDGSGTHGDIETAGGGALLHDAYEAIDLLVHLLGRPESVYAQRAAPGKPVSPVARTHEAVFMTLRFADELVGSVAVLGGSTAWQAGSTDPSWAVTIAGTTATATISPGALRISSGEVGGSPAQAGKVESTSKPALPVSRALSAFGGALLSGVEEVKGAAEKHLATLAVIEAAYLSARTAAPEAPGRLLG